MVRRRGSRDLSDRPLSYDLSGVTVPGDTTWRPATPGFPTFQASEWVGDASAWPALAEAVMRWEVKIRSGFSVAPVADAQCGRNFWLTARFGAIAIHEPVRVVAEVHEPDRRGFAYGTLVGHPVSGEEAFVAHRDGDNVYLTLRSVTRPGVGMWRFAFPAAFLAQRLYRRRYLRALRT